VLLELELLELELEFELVLEFELGDVDVFEAGPDGVAVDVVAGLGIDVVKSTELVETSKGVSHLSSSQMQNSAP